MNATDALKRLAGCRAAQPGLGQILVGSEVVDALLHERRDVCAYCHQPEGHSPRCAVTRHGAAEMRECADCVAPPFHDYQTPAERSEA